MRYYEIISERHSNQLETDKILSDQGILIGLEFEMVLNIDDSDQIPENIRYEDFLKLGYSVSDSIEDQIEADFIQWCRRTNHIPEIRNMDKYIDGAFINFPEFVEHYGFVKNILSYYRDVAKQLEEILGEMVSVSRNHVRDKKPDCWIIESDPSIHPDQDKGIGAEIVSPPLKINDAILSMQKIFSWMKNNGHYTNYTTGLHVNVSLSGKGYQHIDPLKLVLFYDENYVAKMFNREDNSYSERILNRLSTRITNSYKVKPKTDRALQQDFEKKIYNNRVFDEITKELSMFGKDMIATMGKESTIYLRGNEVVEFRNIGGDDYETQFNLIRKQIINFANIMGIACNPLTFRKEYIQKVIRLFHGKLDEIKKIKKVPDILRQALPAWTNILEHYVDEQPIIQFSMNRNGVINLTNCLIQMYEQEQLFDPSITQISQLRRLMNKFGIAPNDLDDFFDLRESASSGATGAANVASVAAPLGDSLGAGFDPSQMDRSIYGKKKSKVLVIKRNMK